jgi:3-oxoacyl-[acyl-carrier protein] reductase
MGKLDGRIALVTGGSRGIGRGIALELAREGADVIVNYRKDRDGDVGKYDQVEALVDEGVRALGGLDVVVANSGVASRPAPVATLSVEEWHRVIDVDLHGVFYTLRATTPRLLERGKGTILVVSSVGADLCTPGGAPYYAAKAGANALTKVLARELAPQKIRVNAIALGEPLLAGIPLGRPGTPEEVGKLAAFLASDDAAFITGKIYRIDGGAWM